MLAALQEVGVLNGIRARNVGEFTAALQLQSNEIPSCFPFYQLYKSIEYIVFVVVFIVYDYITSSLPTYQLSFRALPGGRVQEG